MNAERACRTTSTRVSTAAVNGWIDELAEFAQFGVRVEKAVGLR